MARTISITAGDIEVLADLNDSKTADAIWDALPLEFHGSRWGEEIYGSIGLNLSQESPQEEMEVGDLAYWPPGSAFCIFFGPTPASVADEPRAASAVSPFGRVQGDATTLTDTPPSMTVLVQKASQ
jgi:hypothetical protein